MAIYIGISLNINNHKVCVCCESIVNGETIVIYTWIIQTLSKIEPHWSCSNIRIMFVNGFIIPRLLHNLGIVNSCVLHGACSCLLNEVWPSKENDSETIYKSTKKYIRVMIISKKHSRVEQWLRWRTCATKWPSSLVGYSWQDP